MQNTLNFEKTNPLQAMEGVARAMALPHEFPPTRFPSFPALERTAVMGFNSPGTVVAGTGYSSGLLMRQAAYPLWYQMPYTNSSYYARYAIPNLATGASEYEIPNPSELLTGNNSSTGGFCAVTNSNSSIVHPIVGVDFGSDQRPFIYVPFGYTLTFVVGSSTGATFASDPMAIVYGEYFTSPGETASAAFPLSWGLASMASYSSTLPYNSWFRPTKFETTSGTFVTAGFNFRLTVVVSAGATTLAAPTLTVTTPGSSITSLLPFCPPAEFSNSQLPFMSTRLTAVAALFTNVTKALNKEGTVIAGRIAPQITNVWQAVPADVTNIHPAEKQLLGLESGFYTYCPPSTDLSDFWDYTTPYSWSAKPVPMVRLDNSSLVNYFAFNDPDGGTNLAVNLDWHIEFRCTSALWQIGLSTMTLESFHQAQLALVSAGFFFPNESHKYDIATIVGKIGKWAGKAAKVVSVVHPVAGGALKAGSMIMSSKPKKTPKPTTLHVKSAPPAGKPHKGKANKPKSSKRK